MEPGTAFLVWTTVRAVMEIMVEFVIILETKVNMARRIDVEQLMMKSTMAKMIKEKKNKEKNGLGKEERE